MWLFLLFTTCEWQTLDNNVTNHFKWFWVFNISISSLDARNGVNEASIHSLNHFKERLLLMRKPHRYTFILRISIRLKQIEWNSVFFDSAIIFTFYHQPFTIRHSSSSAVEGNWTIWMKYEHHRIIALESSGISINIDEMVFFKGAFNYD